MKVRDDSLGMAWMWRRMLGPVGLTLHIYRHRYPQAPDRWVVQPTLTFDRSNRA